MSNEITVGEGRFLLGYQTVRPGRQRFEAWAKRQTLLRFALDRGLCLAEVYVHELGRGPTGALGKLIRAAGDPQVAAVAVVSEEDLSESPEVRSAIRRWLKTEAGVDVLVVES